MGFVAKHPINYVKCDLASKTLSIDASTMSPRRKQRGKQRGLRKRVQRVYITSTGGRYPSLKKLWAAHGPQGIAKRMPKEFATDASFEAWLRDVLDDYALVVKVYRHL
jgi:hypothetical protein